MSWAERSRVVEVGRIFCYMYLYSQLQNRVTYAGYAFHNTPFETLSCTCLAIVLVLRHILLARNREAQSVCQFRTALDLYTHSDWFHRTGLCLWYRNNSKRISPFYFPNFLKHQNMDHIQSNRAMWLIVNRPPVLLLDIQYAPLLVLVAEALGTTQSVITVW